MGAHRFANLGILKSPGPQDRKKRMVVSGMPMMRLKKPMMKRWKDFQEKNKKGSYTYTVVIFKRDFLFEVLFRCLINIWVVLSNLFYFAPTRGNDPIWQAFVFQMGWFNHQLEKGCKGLGWTYQKMFKNTIVNQMI